MNDWLDLLLNSDSGTSAVGSHGLLFTMLLAFILGHFVGFVYMWTHESLSYSRTFVTSLVVLPPLVAVMMILMAGSILVAFGLLAVFGVIRFRNVLKDTRDTVFILWGITEGLGVGTMRYSTAMVGAVGIAAVSSISASPPSAPATATTPWSRSASSATRWPLAPCSSGSSAATRCGRSSSASTG